MPIKVILTWGPLGSDAKKLLIMGSVFMVAAVVMLGCIHLFFVSVDGNGEWSSAHLAMVTLLASVCVFDFAALLFGCVFLIVGIIMLVLSKFKRNSN